MITDPPILTIRRNFERPSAALVEAFRGVPTGYLVDAMQGRGKMRADGENQVKPSLRRQGETPTNIKKRRMSAGTAIMSKELAIFTRQLATMMKAGVPLLQRFDGVGRGSPTPRIPKLLNDIRTDVETDKPVNGALRKVPM